jgi:hypothetical protein
MSKLRLDVENLVVESFEVADEDRERGTVVANAATNRPGCQSIACPISDDDPTCAISCGHIDTSCPYICA